MSVFAYRLAKGVGQFIFMNTMRLKVLRPQAARFDGPLLIACSHLSHTDPFLLTVVVRRQIDWFARVEFWKYRLIGHGLECLDAIAVRRFGVAASAVRTGIRRLKSGRIVGICPEGGVTQGAQSILRGGPMKKGVCLLSYRTGVPILPCVILGSDKLNRPGPWLPFKRARLWVGFGARLIYPESQITDRRAAREVMAGKLSREFQVLFAEVRQEFGIDEKDVP
ncbi:MAG TPA: lysophospholipid acyltransferase family protein [Tepidisphaeraceae bacterium]|nr:lysophospholipid acyltransferase family protein [Tepidisphaeraceae bacterium]